jgi:hypothetical protein
MFMEPEEYLDLLADLGLDIKSGADAIGVHWRTSYRYALGEQRIPAPVAKLLRLMAAVNRPSRARR